MPLLWRFYRSFEPAYVYGRTARMDEGAVEWDIYPAAFSSRLVIELDREVTTLHINVRTSLRHGRLSDDRAVFDEFLKSYETSGALWPLD